MGVLCLASALLSFPARGADAPAAAPDIVLRVRGTSAQSEVAFDLAALAKLPVHTYIITLPWDQTERRFTGVLIRDVLAAAHLPLANIKATGLNDYWAPIPAIDLRENGALIAYQVDGKTMSVRNRGPLMVVYPFKDRPELRSATTESRCVWQLTSISVDPAALP